MITAKERLEKSKNNLKIAMVSIPDLGHFIPMLRIGEELAKEAIKLLISPPAMHSTTGNF